MTPTLHLYCKVELFQRQRSVDLEMPGEAQEQLGPAPEFTMPGAENDLAKVGSVLWHSFGFGCQTHCFVFANFESCRCGCVTKSHCKGTLKEDGVVAMHLLPSQIRPVKEPPEGDAFGEEHPTTESPI